MRRQIFCAWSACIGNFFSAHHCAKNTNWRISAVVFKEIFFCSSPQVANLDWIISLKTWVENLTLGHLSSNSRMVPSYKHFLPNPCFAHRVIANLPVFREETQAPLLCIYPIAVLSIWIHWIHIQMQDLMTKNLCTYFCGSFLFLLDPDLGTPLNTDPIRIRNTVQ